MFSHFTRMDARRIVVSTLSLMLVACPSAPTASPEPPPIDPSLPLTPGLNGVLYGADGQPLASRDIRILALAADGQPTAAAPLRALTDSSGRYRLTVEPGSYTVSALEAGQGAMARGLFVERLPSGGVSKVLADLHLASLGRVSAGSAVISTATVSLAGTTLAATTDASGRYAIDGVPPGNHAVKATLTGYRPVSQGFTLEPGATVRFDPVLSLDQPTVRVDVLDPPFGQTGDTVAVFGTRFGTARASSSVAFGGVQVADANILSWSDSRVVVRVPPVAASASVTVRVGSDEARSAHPFQVLARLLKASGDLQLVPPGGGALGLPLSVQVLDAASSPIAGVGVSFAGDLGTPTRPFVYTDADGRASTGFVTLDDQGEFALRGYVIGLPGVTFTPPRVTIAGQLIPEFNFLAHSGASFRAGEAVVRYRESVSNGAAPLAATNGSGLGLLHRQGIAPRVLRLGDPEAPQSTPHDPQRRHAAALDPSFPGHHARRAPSSGRGRLLVQTR